MTGARRGAVGITALTILITAADAILRRMESAARGSPDGLTLLPMVLTLAAVGGLVAARRPRNAYGWILAGAGAGLAINMLSIDYAAAAVVRGYPGAEAAAYVAVIAASAWWSTFVTFVPLLYPTGTLPTARWRWVGWVAGAGIVLMTIGLTWTAVVTGAPEVVRRFRLNLPVEESGAAEAINTMGHIGVFFGLLAGVVAVVVRWRRADAIQRLQLKWFAFGATLAAFSILVAPLLAEAMWLEVIALTTMPLVIGIAILRWHLYDIDRIISRTLGYALLTALLAGIYLLAVTLLTRITAPVAGDSPVAVAAATLLAAAAFQPARRRIQSVVDRRFNRARYDARHTVETFATTLRQEVDLDDVRTHLVGTIGDVLQPTNVTVWLRTGTVKA